MPEVIEVLKYADFLRSKLKHNKITDIKILKGRYKTHGAFENFDALHAALPLKVKSIHTKGKFLYILFENDMYLFSTLGLSGGWVWSSTTDKDTDKDKGKDLIKASYHFGHLLKHIDKSVLDNYHQKALNHCNVEFVTDAGTLYYYDVLSYGTLKVVTSEADVTKKLATIGPDMSDKSTTYPIFKARLEKAAAEKPIGTVLMNQRLLSGIGNYLRADVLWLSKISPFRTMKTLSDEDLKNLYTNTRMLIWAKYDYKKGVKLGFIDPAKDKTPEDYKREFYVYDQKTDPQDHPVKKEELYDGSQKRFIYWTPAVQK